MDIKLLTEFIDSGNAYRMPFCHINTFVKWMTDNDENARQWKSAQDVGDEQYWLRAVAFFWSPEAASVRKKLAAMMAWKGYHVSYETECGEEFLVIHESQEFMRHKVYSYSISRFLSCAETYGMPFHSEYGFKQIALSEWRIKEFAEFWTYAFSHIPTAKYFREFEKFFWSKKGAGLRRRLKCEMIRKGYYVEYSYRPRAINVFVFGV